MNKPNEPQKGKRTAEQLKQAAKQAQAKQPQQQKPAPPPEPEEPPEDSVPLRFVVFLMTIICIGSGCYFVDTPILMTCLYILFAVGGCYLSYQYRHEQSKWLHVFVAVGMVGVALNSGHELFTGCGTGRFQLFAPVVHFVAGTFIMHSFEAKTRSDINMSSALGLLLLCLMAPVGKSIIYGACVLAYISLGTIMLYFDCISRTMQTWLPKPIALAPIEELSSKRKRRSSGSTVIAMALLPVFSVALFLFIPRFDNIIDVLVNAFHKLYEKQKVQMPEMKDGGNDPNHKFVHKQRQKKEKEEQKKPPKEDPNVVEERPQDKSNKDTPKKERDEQDKKDKKDKKKDKKDKKETKDDPKTEEDESKVDEQDPNKQQSSDSASAESGQGESKDKTGKNGGSGGGNKGDARADQDKMPLIVDSDLNTQQLLFTVNCNRTLFFRLTALDKFDGATWYHSLTKKDKPRVFGEQDNDQGFYHLKDAPSLQAEDDATSLTQDIVAQTDLTKNIPAASVPQKITNNWKTISVDGYGTLHADVPIAAKTKYQVESAVPLYDLKKMRKEPNIGVKMEDQIRVEQEPYLQIPENQSLTMFNKAEEIAKEGNWFNQSERILWYLRKNYTYSLSPPARGTTNVIDIFMQEKTGDCRCFASTFVMMTRAVGIPSRMVAGYAPGDFNKMSGLREVYVRHSHAWAEVFIPRHGWVPFDATPNGTLPDKPKELTYDFGSLSKGPSSGIGSSLQAPPEEITPIRWIIIVTAVILSMILCFFLYRAIRRMLSAWRQKNAHVNPAVKILRKLLSDLSFLDFKRSPGDTATDLAKKINQALRERSEEGKVVDPAIYKLVDTFMETYTVVYFGNRNKHVEDLKRQADDIKFRAKSRSNK